MPYDHAKTRDLLKIAAAYAQHPLGEYVSQLSTQLFDAETEINAITKSTADVRSEVDEANRRLMAESQAHRATKEKLSEEIRVLQEHKMMLVSAMNAISADARGAKKLAQEALAKLNPTPASPTT